MKRLGNLINQENITLEFCEWIIRTTVKGKTNRSDAAEIARHIKGYAPLLRSMVLEDQPDNTFKPAPYKFTERIENGKKRKLCQPKLWPDQCIHHVLIDLIKDKLIARMDPYACSSIPFRGTEAAYNASKKWIQEERFTHTKYTLKIDIKKCFDSLKAEVAYNEMAKVVKDKRWLELFHRVIFNHPTLPIGLYPSAWILNTILKPLDDKIRAFNWVHHYVRYMDDMCIFGPNKKKLRCLLDNVIVPELAKFGFRVKENWQLFLTDNPKVENRHGVDFVGKVIYRDKTLMRKRNFRKLRRTALRFERRLKTGEDIPLRECQGFVSMAGGTHNVYRKIIREKYLLPAHVELIKDKISVKTRRPMKAKKYKSYFLNHDIKERIKNLPTKRRIRKRNLELNRVGRLRTFNKLFWKCETAMDFYRLKTNGRMYIGKDLYDYMFCPMRYIEWEFTWKCYNGLLHPPYFRTAEEQQAYYDQETLGIPGRFVEDAAAEIAKHAYRERQKQYFLNHFNNGRHTRGIKETHSQKMDRLMKEAKTINYHDIKGAI